MADPQPPEIPGRARPVNAGHDGDLSSSPGGHLPLPARRVFVGDEVSLDVSFAAAQARLASVIRGGLLGRASEQAYGDGMTGLARVGPLGPVPGLSRLVQVHAQDLDAIGDAARFALRWEAIGPGGELFPALDADITLAPAGEHAATLTLAGAYRPPLGAADAELDRAVMHRAHNPGLPAPRRRGHRLPRWGRPAVNPRDRPYRAGNDPRLGHAGLRGTQITVAAPSVWPSARPGPQRPAIA